MGSVRHLLGNPHDVDISLLIPTLDIMGFQNLYNSLMKYCSKPKRVELLLKIDNIDNIKEYYNICKQSQCKYKIILYPKFNGRCSLHYFFNDLAYISSGRMVWFLNDDATVKGDWYKVLMSTRNAFKDNVYCVIIPLDNGKGTKQIVPLPALSREWVKKFGDVTKFPNFDRWVNEISRGLKRRVIISEKDLIVSMPQGSRVLSKQDRKDLFFPTVEKYLKKYKRRLSK